MPVQKPYSSLHFAVEGTGTTYPQHKHMSAGYDYESPQSVRQLPFDAIPTFEPDFSTVNIEYTAALTDLISSSPINNCGYLISGKFRALLEKYRLPLHAYYPVPMTYRNREISDYWWLHLPQPKLVIAPTAPREEVEKLVEESELAEVDIFRIYQPSRYSYCYVNSRLRTAIELEKISGVRFESSRLFR